MLDLHKQFYSDISGKLRHSLSKFTDTSSSPCVFIGIKGSRPNFSQFVILSLNSRPRYQIIVNMGNAGKTMGNFDGEVKKLTPRTSQKRCAKKE